jgi:hypothetical protein
MLVRLKVLKESPPRWEQVFEIEKDVIHIGRDPKSELQLEGTSSAVSRQHARIVRHGDSYSIVDLNSRNGVLLNNKRIKPDVEYDLKNGDLINICEFVIEFSAEQSELKPTQILAAEEKLADLFAEESKNLIAALDQISQKFEGEGSSQKEEALMQALRDSFDKVTVNKATEILSQALQSRMGLTVSLAGPPPGEQKLDVALTYDRIERVIDIMLDFFVKMIQAYVDFRKEFLTETMIKPGKSFSLYHCTPKQLKEFLFDPESSFQESQKRIDRIQNVAAELQMHLLSLLLGYRASVHAGTQGFLAKLNPEKAKEELAQNALRAGPVRIPCRLIPLLVTLQTIKKLSETHRELKQEDRAKIEEKCFRPPFVEAYNKEMGNIRKRNLSPDREE